MFWSGVVTIPLALSNVILINLGLFNINLFCNLHSFFAHCVYLIVEFYVSKKQK